MARERKTAAEIQKIITDRMRGLGMNHDPWFVRVVGTQPSTATKGANWRVATEGRPDDFSKAIGRVVPNIQMLYDLTAD